MGLEAWKITLQHYICVVGTIHHLIVSPKIAVFLRNTSHTLYHSSRNICLLRFSLVDKNSKAQTYVSAVRLGKGRSQRPFPGKDCKQVVCHCAEKYSVILLRCHWHLIVFSAAPN